MKMTTLFAVVALCTSLAFAGLVQAKEKEQSAETISKADVPVAVQQAANTAAKGSRIVRWEKEGKRYDAVVKNDENGKRTRLIFDEKGKLLTRRDETKPKHD